MLIFGANLKIKKRPNLKQRSIAKKLIKDRVRQLAESPKVASTAKIITS